MSISPTQTQDTTSSSSITSPFPNPSAPNHGPFQPNPTSLSRQFPHPLSPSAAPGPLAAATEGSGGSSEKVIELGTPNGNRSSAQPEGAADLFSASAQPKARMSRAAASPRGELTGSSRSGNSQGGNLHASGRRAQMMNANHLLNFHYDPIVRSKPRPPPPPRRQYKIKPYNKDLFIQANYKFVVLDTGNYAPELMDPDKMLRWEDIICLRYSTPAPVQCPICLDDPLCPQITSCGHIFCFPCILQYLMGKEDEKGDCFKRCPLCFMMVSLKDLYTIYIENVRQHIVGDTVEFMLLTRAKDSFTPAQKSKQESNKSSNCGTGDPFSKFTFTTDVDLSVRKAISDLDDWLARADSGLVDDLEKLPYVCAAMGQLEQRKKYWSEHHACSRDRSSEYVEHLKRSEGLLSTASSTDGHQDFRYATQPINVINQPKPLDNLMLDEGWREAMEGQDTILSSLSDETESETLQRPSNADGDAKDKESYNFYQAVDGQHIILHPLNMKCLLHHFGNYDMLPNRINGRILQLETVSQSEATRRRYRYLSHFSLTTTYQLCEIDLSGMLPPNALLPFLDEIKKREKQRKQLAKKERKETIKAETAAAVHSAAVSFSFGQCSHDNSPQFSLDDFEALGSCTAMSSSPPSFGERISFSNVTRLGYAAGHDSPALKMEERNSSDLNMGASDALSVAGGGRNSGTAPSFAKVISREKCGENLGASNVGKKGKKQGRVLLSTTSGRRY